MNNNVKKCFLKPKQKNEAEDFLNEWQIKKDL